MNTLRAGMETGLFGEVIMSRLEYRMRAGMETGPYGEVIMSRLEYRMRAGAETDLYGEMMEGAGLKTVCGRRGNRPLRKTQDVM